MYALEELKQYGSILRKVRKLSIQPTYEVSDLSYLPYFIDARNAEKQSRNIMCFIGGQKAPETRKTPQHGLFNEPLDNFLQQRSKEKNHIIGVGNISACGHVSAFSIFKENDHISIIAIDSTTPGNTVEYLISSNTSKKTPNYKFALFHDIEALAEFASTSPNNHVGWILTEIQNTPSGCGIISTNVAIALSEPDMMLSLVNMHRNMHAGKPIHAKAKEWKAHNSNYRQFFQSLPQSEGRTSFLEGDFLPEDFIYDAHSFYRVKTYIENQDAGYDSSSLINIHESVTVRKSDLEGKDLDDFNAVCALIKMGGLNSYKLRKANSEGIYVLTPSGFESINIASEDTCKSNGLSGVAPVIPAESEVLNIFSKQLLIRRDLIEDIFPPAVFVQRSTARQPLQSGSFLAQGKDDGFDAVTSFLHLDKNVHGYFVKKNTRGYRITVPDLREIHDPYLAPERLLPRQVFHEGPSEVLQTLDEWTRLPEDDLVIVPGDDPSAARDISGRVATRDQQITYERAGPDHISSELSYADGRQVAIPAPIHLIKRDNRETGDFKRVDELFNSWVSYSWNNFNNAIDKEKRPDLIDLTIRHMESQLHPEESPIQKNEQIAKKRSLLEDISGEEQQGRDVKRLKLWQPINLSLTSETHGGHTLRPRRKKTE